MAINIASLGEMARQALPVNRLLRNVGVLSTPESQAADPEQADGPAPEDDDFATVDLAGDAIPAPVDGQPKTRGFRNKRSISSDDVSLGDRFSAWWHGDDIDVYAEPEPEPEPELDESPSASAEPWGPQRIELAKHLWGESFIEPGGVPGARRLFAQIMPTSKQSVLDLTAGLGGTALTLAKDLNLWMEAMEPDPLLAKHASQYAELYRLNEQVPVARLDLGNINIVEEKYNLIYSRERLFSIPEKLPLLEAAARGLKQGGQLMLTDLMVPNSVNMQSDAYQAWVEREPQWPEPWTLSLYTKTLEDLGLKVASRQNLTKQYLSESNAGWQKMSRILEDEEEEFDLELADQLMREGDVWVARTRALEAGDLSYCRIVAWRAI